MGLWNTRERCQPWGWADYCYSCEREDDGWLDIDLGTIALIVLIILGILLIIAILLPLILLFCGGL